MAAGIFPDILAYLEDLLDSGIDLTRRDPATSVKSSTAMIAANSATVATELEAAMIEAAVKVATEMTSVESETVAISAEVYKVATEGKSSTELKSTPSMTVVKLATVAASV